MIGGLKWGDMCQDQIAESILDVCECEETVVALVGKVADLITYND